MSILPSPLKSAVPQASNGDWSLMVVIFQRISPADAKEMHSPVAMAKACKYRTLYGYGDMGTYFFTSQTFR